MPHEITGCPREYLTRPVRLAHPFVKPSLRSGQPILETWKASERTVRCNFLFEMADMRLLRQKTKGA
jgi:hypothetical protein